MKLLPILGGLFAQIDDDDFELLSKFNWHLSTRRKTKFYIVRSSYYNDCNHKIYLHREIMKASKGQMVDHKDMNVLNNQKSNLRFCTHGENNQNTIKRSNASSKYKGVSFCNTYKKWICLLMKDGKSILRKRFDSEIDAAQAYNMACIKHHDEFARPNIL